MSLFQCSQCRCVENTACCNYWFRKVKNMSLLCSECDPDINKWHNRFAKRSAIGMFIDQSGNLWSKDNISELPQHYKIVGEVQQ